MRLVGDVGGTHARFARVTADGRLGAPVSLPSSEFGDLASAVGRALELLARADPESAAGADAAIAVAGPVTGDRVELTNVAWRFSIEESRLRLGFARLLVVNDIAALASALPVLGAHETRTLVEGARGASGVRTVVAVGTGLGVATVVDTGGGEVVLPSEGGHRDLAAAGRREWQVVEWLADRLGGHVSAERVLSGPGLAQLHAALSALAGGGPALPAEQVGPRALAGEPRAREAMSLFAGWLGAFAGDLALTVGARGGVYLAGGVVPALGAAFDTAAFTERFLAKGRFRAWLSAVPVRLVLDGQAALRGLVRRLPAGG
jgi:glucokinase